MTVELSLRPVTLEHVSPAFGLNGVHGVIAQWRVEGVWRPGLGMLPLLQDLVEPFALGMWCLPNLAWWTLAMASFTSTEWQRWGYSELHICRTELCASGWSSSMGMEWKKMGSNLKIVAGFFCVRVLPEFMLNLYYLSGIKSGQIWQQMTSIAYK